MTVSSSVYLAMYFILPGRRCEFPSGGQIVAFWRDSPQLILTQPHRLMTDSLSQNQGRRSCGKGKTITKRAKKKEGRRKGNEANQGRVWILLGIFYIYYEIDSVSRGDSMSKSKTHPADGVDCKQLRKNEHALAGDRLTSNTSGSKRSIEGWRELGEIVIERTHSPDCLRGASLRVKRP